MSILNVDKIQPIGGGSTITVDATDIQASTGTITANSYTGVDNTLKVSIGGTEYVRTHSTGQVSIGSTFMWRTDTVAQVYGKSPDLSLSRFNDQFMIAGNETSGAINTGAGIQLFGHDGVSERGMAYIRGLKENGTSGDRASYLAFATRVNGGTLEERLRIKSNGDVIWNGIGTQLAGEGNNTVGMGFEPRNGTIFLSRGDNATILSNRNNDGRHIHFNQGGSNKFAIGLQNSGADLAFFSGAGNSPTERLRITSGGSVNIGGDYTQTTYKLRVSGTSYLGGVVRVPNGSAAAPAIHFGDSDSGVYGDSSNGVRLTAGGSDTIVATTNGVTFPPQATALTSFTLGSQSALSKPLYFADAASVQSASILLDNSSQELRIKNGRFSGQITFTTYNTEKLRIESGGDVKINTGDIYFATAGKGIVLGATSNTDAHTLDHYEEGTTGLTVKCGSVTVPLLNNTCKWTRIGNTLHVSAWIRISGGANASGISATDPVKITGFPFATVGNNTGRTRLVFTGYSFGGVSNVTWGWMVVGDGATTHEHELHWGNLNFSLITAPDGANITSGGNYLSSEIYLNGHMFV